MTRDSQQAAIGADQPHFRIDNVDSEAAAWTEIEEGRFMPRRIRGSFLGRALG